MIEVTDRIGVENVSLTCCDYSRWFYYLQVYAVDSGPIGLHRYVASSDFAISSQPLLSARPVPGTAAMSDVVSTWYKREPTRNG